MTDIDNPKPYTVTDLDLWRRTMHAVVQPELHLLRFIATIDALASELEAARKVVVEATERHESWCGCGSVEDEPIEAAPPAPFVDPLCAALAEYLRVMEEQR